MGTKQMTLLEKLQVTHTNSRAELLKAELPCMVLLGWLSQAKGGQNSHFRGSRQLGRQWDAWKCQALLWEMHWEFSKMKQNCV